LTSGASPSEERASDARGWFSRHGAKLVTSLVIAFGFGWLLHGGALPLAPEKSAFERVRWWTVGGFFLISASVHLVRATRWSLLLAPMAKVPLRRILGVSFIGFAAIVLLPFRTGEAVRPLLIRKHGNVSGWAATGTIAAERIIDGLVVNLMLLAGLSLSTPLSPLPDHIGNLPISPAIVPRAAYTMLTFFAVAFTVMGVFYAKREWARRMTLSVIGVISPKLATWLADRVENVGQGLGFLPNARLSIPFIGATVLYWMLNASGVWLMGWGCGFDRFSYTEACTAIGVIALGILVPNAPGFFGAFQLAFYAALAVYYPPEMVTGPGAALVLLVYCGQLLTNLVAAVIGFILEKTGVREALADEPVST
jgi:hypothetical protein